MRVLSFTNYEISQYVMDRKSCEKIYKCLQK